MKYIYNESEVPEEQTAYERETKQVDRFTCGGLILGAIGMLLCICNACLFDSLPVSVVGGFLGLLGFGTYASWQGEYPDTPAILRFYRASKKGRILNVIVRANDEWLNDWVFAQVETSGGIVEDVAICPVCYKKSTRHSDVTFDVHQGIIFIPYHKEVE